MRDAPHGADPPRTARAGGDAGPGARTWIDSDLKIQMLVFFHDNPGVVETADGLARRLGLRPDALSDGIRDHVALGILSERDIGRKKIYLYNRSAEKMAATQLRDAVERRMQGGVT